jgi:PKD repeat protein
MFGKLKRGLVFTTCVALCGVGLASLTTPEVAHAAQRSVPGPVGMLPSAVPGTNTPAVDDGRVFGVAKLGDTMVIGGNFTSVDGQARNGIAAFDQATGDLTSFAPTLNNYVNQVIPGPNEHTVYVAGAFTTVNGKASTLVTELDLNNSQIVAGFVPPKIQYNEAKDIVLSGNRLYVAGSFTKANGIPHGGLVALNATTGALDPFVNLQFTGHHRDDPSTGAQGAVGPSDLDVTADGNTMVIIGNFKMVDGLLRDQVAVIDLTGATAQVSSNWATHAYEPQGSKQFDMYVRGVSLSPDDSYFVIATTRGPHVNTLTDAAARFELDTVSTDVQPTWVDETGGDTLWGVTVTNSAVYVGGHNRWMNNPWGSNTPHSGAVPRAGLEALDPQTGRPLSWNPGRVPLGVSVFAFLATDEGLYLGSDTDYIGDHKYKRQKIAFFPWAGGTQISSTATATLPGTVYLGSNSSSTNQLRLSDFDGTTATAAQSISTQGIDFNNWRGAVYIGGTVFYGYTDNFMYERSFDGSTFGPAMKIDPYHDPLWAAVLTGDHDTTAGQYFDGVDPSLYGQFNTKVTGMAYANGRLYYTLTGDSHLYSRWFVPDSGIVDERFTSVTGSVSLSSAQGMFITGGRLYYVSKTDGTMRSVAFDNGTITGSATVVGSGVDWRNRALFLYKPPPTNVSPSAAFTSNCTDLGCDFDASGSTDTDGAIVSYDWDFGDGQTGNGASRNHVYGTAGTYDVALTVTDNRGGTDSVTHQVTATAPPPTTLDFVAATDGGGGNVKSKQVIVPSAAQVGDTMLLTLGKSATATWTTPAGWTQVDTATNGSLTSTVWTKQVTSSDLHTAITLTTGSYTHASLNLAVYRGVDAANPNDVVAHSSDTTATTHLTPTVAAGSGDWLVSIWSDRASATVSWTLPSDVTSRDSSADSGNPSVQAVVADSGDGVSGGTNGGFASTTDIAPSSTVMFTIALKPS